MSETHSAESSPTVSFVTGASGFVGGHLCRHLTRSGHRVHGLIRDVGDTVAVDGVTTHRSDILDEKRIQRILGDVRPDVVFHLAARADVGASWKHRRATIETNSLGCLSLMDGLLEAGLDDTTLLVVGSASQYGPVDASEQPITEAQSLSPTSPYGSSKVCQEVLALQYHRSYGVNVILARPFNHTGPGQSKGFVVPDFASQVAAIEAGEKTGPIRVGNLAAKRDCLDVRDVVRAYATLSERGEVGEVYNVCRGEATAIETLLDVLIEETNMQVKVEVDPELYRPVDIPVHFGDNSKIRETTGWMPRIPLRQTLVDTLNHWRELHREGKAVR